MNSDLVRNGQTGGFPEQAGGPNQGRHRGFVIDRTDPERLGRLRLKVPSLLADTVTGWAWPATSHTELFVLPRVGDQVWVEFADGDLGRPSWSSSSCAAVSGGSEVPAGARGICVDTAVLRTPAGIVIIVTDDDGAERITIRSPGGCEVTLDAVTSRVTVRDGEAVERDAAVAARPPTTGTLAEQI